MYGGIYIRLLWFLLLLSLLQLLLQLLLLAENVEFSIPTPIERHLMCSLGNLQWHFELMKIERCGLQADKKQFDIFEPFRIQYTSVTYIHRTVKMNEFTIDSENLCTLFY